MPRALACKKLNNRAHSPACVAAGMRRGLHVEWLMDNVLFIW